MSDTRPTLWERRRLIRESSLTIQQKCLLMIIDDYCGDSGDCFASVPTLADNVSLRVRQTQGLVRSLEQLEVIYRTDRPGRSALMGINWQVVQRTAGVQQNAGVQRDAPEGCSPMQGRGATGCGGGVQPSAYELPFNTPVTPKVTPSVNREHKRFKKPTVAEVRAYCQERGNTVDPERFTDHYESKGWKVGKAAMKDWRASVRTWEKNQTQERPEGNGRSNTDSRNRRRNSGQLYDPSTVGGEVIV